MKGGDAAFIGCFGASGAFVAAFGLFFAGIALGAGFAGGASGSPVAGVVIGLIFAACGAGIVGYASAMPAGDPLAALFDAAAGKPVDPSAPWRSDARWRRFRVVAARPAGLLPGIGGLALIPLAGGFALPVLHARDAGVVSRAALGALALTAPVLIALGAGPALRARKYGRPVLHLARLPLVPGSRIEGAIVVDGSAELRERVRLVLRCVRSGAADPGGTTLAEVAIEVPPEDLLPLAPRGALVPVRIDVPPGLPDRTPAGDPRHAWTLEASAALVGFDFAAVFADLPVYAVEPARVEARTEPMPGSAAAAAPR